MKTVKRQCSSTQIDQHTAQIHHWSCEAPRPAQPKSNSIPTRPYRHSHGIHKDHRSSPRDSKTILPGITTNRHIGPAAEYAVRNRAYMRKSIRWTSITEVVPNSVNELTNKIPIIFRNLQSYSDT